MRPPKTSRPGSVEVRSHLRLAPGLELIVSPEGRELSEERLREFIKSLLELTKSFIPESRPPRPSRACSEDPAPGGGDQPDGEAPEVDGQGQGGQAPLTWLNDVVDFSLNLDPRTLKQVEESLRDPYNIDKIFKTFNKATIKSKKIPKAKGWPPGPATRMVVKGPPKKNPETTIETVVTQGHRPWPRALAGNLATG